MRKLIVTSLLIQFVLAAAAANVHAAEIHHAQGELAGEVTASSVLLQSRLTAIAGPVLDKDGDVPGAAGVACFEWSEGADFASSKRTAWIKAMDTGDFIVRAKLADLKAGQLYHYRLVFGADEKNTQTGPARQFKTLPTSKTNEPLTFIMGSCMHYYAFMSGKPNGGGPVTATDEDKKLGYPSFAAMAALKPDFFIGTGDIVYYDHPSIAPARTLPQLRMKWHEQFRFPRMVEFFARTPAYFSKDDHDFRFNDADLLGEKLPSPTTGIELFREQMPIHEAGDQTSPTYRTHRVHQHLQLWFVEGRDFRSPNNMKDGPEKTIWGKEQRGWLERTLKESDATWKIIITPTPMVGPDSTGKKDNHVNPQGFRHEADSFFAYLKDNRISNVMTFCGDRHWQYHSIHPTGLEEFGCGAINDENSIRGTRAGTKNSSDPDGLIQQKYIYNEPTGGFIQVKLEPSAEGKAKLRITFRDDHGKLMHEVVK